MLRRVKFSVRSKLLALMLATTAVALAVAFTALIVYDLRTYHERWVSDLSTQAEILGRASVAALAFDDPKAAGETLALLRVRRPVLGAAIYNEHDRLFASYRRDDAIDGSLPERPSAPGVTVGGDELILFHSIVENNRVRGTVYLRARYELVERLADYLRILALVMLASMVAAFIISSWLQKMITVPILGITDVARNVMESRDFSLRAEKTTDDEIGYLVDAFNNMLMEIGRRSDALLAADRMKDQFLATLAHELRNPLAPISNALHLLEIADDRPRVAADARAMMARQLKQMVRLVDDLLDVSRITTGKLTLQCADIELRSILEDAVEIARPLIESRSHRLSVELPPAPVRLYGDETRLAQVFSNMLNNAAKYTDPGGEISIRTRVGQATIAVSVADNGIGISEEMLPAVFEMFIQADNSMERGQAGLGVGLALARKLVEMHGGSISARSGGKGRGSEFTVTLPLRPPLQDSGTPPAN
jgi:signal transduction histidine kinase